MVEFIFEHFNSYSDIQNLDDKPKNLCIFNNMGSCLIRNCSILYIYNFCFLSASLVNITKLSCSVLSGAAFIK